MSQPSEGLMTKSASMAEIVSPEQYAIGITGKDGKLLCAVRYDGTLKFGENYCPDEAAKVFWEALAKHIPASIRTPSARPGWRLVPVEPTEEMKKAAIYAIESGTGTLKNLSDYGASLVYKAMLAAAPTEGGER